MLSKNTPEYAVALFLNHWRNKRFGPLANSIYYISEETEGKRAGQAKRSLGRHSLNSYIINTIDDRTPSATHVETELYFSDSDAVINVSIRVIFLDSNNQSTLRNFSDGSWKIVPQSLDEIYFSVDL